MRKSFWIGSMALPFVLLLGACGTYSSHGIATGNITYPPKPEDAVIDIYFKGSFALPPSPLEEVGRVEASYYGHTAFTNRGRVLENLKNEARKLGADAVIGVEVKGHEAMVLISATGIAVRYKKINRKEEGI